MLNFVSNLLNLIQTIEFQVGRSNISLVEIVQLLFFIIVTFIFASYFSRFLKYQGLKKVIVDKGSRYIISNFISYGICCFLLLVILQTTGFDISIFTVIGGGLGLGIGLGFQDFTKNFVSGLTLLTERKIKTGDYVQLGDLYGFVQEISTRAIVLKQKDGSSVVIPNSHFVENQIVNFHYETNHVRLKLPVTVAYDSNTTLVTEVLLVSAYLDQNILQIPSPQVLFVGFGDNALNFELWVWVESNQMGFKHEIISSLHFTIEHKFRENHIKIPFPQRELWLHNINFAAFKSNVADHLPESNLPEGDIPESGELERMNNTSISEPQISIRAALKKVGCFSHLSEFRLRQIIEIGRLKSLHKRETLFRENDPGDAFYIILSGRIEVYAETLKKQLAILEAGNFFGEMSLMLGVPRTATAKALESTLLFAITNKNFKVLLQKHPDFHEALVEELSNHQEELILRKQEMQENGWLPPEEQETNIVNWVRHRLKTLFNV
ncbi:MscS Mechanosensitive ion channel [[Leptolyngbya] sp. PCC 7376]|uniref:cyclic nucleotide-binding domain-containing protein n=1 Tax=[Leptolyngbya] sp. PCC 7376 TaxID=111781 RepID=UPI00029F42D8|nr:cyclic nucleotide-binding domain-containing protein [[Leptolyngbya] sp. PCC 7376]AFY38775.1 MscS Mechanosensitive ion channel [[Leptolyngbya] sp. PCC 7376]